MEVPFPDHPSELATKVAKRSLSLALKRGQGGINGHEVEITMGFGQLVRDARLQRCISTKTFARRTRLDPEFLFFLESGLASSNEIAEVFGNVTEVLGLTCAEVAKELLAEHTSMTQKEMGAAMRSLGFLCSDVISELLAEPTLLPLEASME